MVMANCDARSIVAMAICLGLTGCGRATKSDPTITFTMVPRRAEGGSQELAPVAGRVKAVRTGQRVVLFAKSGVWWVQPFKSRPFTDVKPDSTWSAETHLGTEYAALLVEPDYRPPATIESLPVRGGSVVAVATVRGTGAYNPPSRRTLTFSGYDWTVSQVRGDRYGPNDYDARNAWVDREGFLHLELTEREGRWTSAEVSLTRSLGYGTYVFVVGDTSNLDPAAELSFLTWDNLGADQHRELDIEIGRRGNPANKDAQYVVQPSYLAGNVFQFPVPPGVLTHTLRWEPDLAHFTTIRGSDSGHRGSVVADRAFTSGVPVSGSETVRINLLYFRTSSSIPPTSHVEVVIEKFEYLP